MGQISGRRRPPRRTADVADGTAPDGAMRAAARSGLAGLTWLTGPTAPVEPEGPHGPDGRMGPIGPVGPWGPCGSVGAAIVTVLRSRSVSSWTRPPTSGPGLGRRTAVDGVGRQVGNAGRAGRQAVAPQRTPVQHGIPVREQQ